jgi:hypothetical protein
MWKLVVIACILLTGAHTPCCAAIELTLRVGDSKPAQGAHAYLVGLSAAAHFMWTPQLGDEMPRPFFRDAAVFTSDDRGRITIDGDLDNTYLFIVHREGYYSAPSQQANARADKLELRPWAKIEGQVLVDAKAPSVQQKVALLTAVPHSSGDQVTLYHDFVLTDAKGDFSFQRVPGGVCHVARWVETPRSPLRTHGVKLQIKPGESKRVLIGGGGASIRGRINLPADLAVQMAELSAIEPNPEQADTPPITYLLTVDEDGAFSCHGVAGGRYRLAVTSQSADASGARRFYQELAVADPSGPEQATQQLGDLEPQEDQDIEGEDEED